MSAPLHQKYLSTLIVNIIVFVVLIIKQTLINFEFFSCFVIGQQCFPLTLKLSNLGYKCKLVCKHSKIFVSPSSLFIARAHQKPTKCLPSTIYLLYMNHLLLCGAWVLAFCKPILTVKCNTNSVKAS